MGESLPHLYLSGDKSRQYLLSGWRCIGPDEAWEPCLLLPDP